VNHDGTDSELDTTADLENLRGRVGIEDSVVE
jgi:hypothetical protein